MKQQYSRLLLLYVLVTGGWVCNMSAAAQSLQRDYEKKPIDLHIALPAVAEGENRQAPRRADTPQSRFAEPQAEEIDFRSGSRVGEQYMEKRSAPKVADNQPPPREPLQIGFGREMPAAYRGDLASRLTWAKQSNGSVVSALSLSSPEAKALRIALRTNWPAGTTLRFFNPTDTKQQLPPLKRQDFTTDNPDEPLWSPVVEGDTLGLEISLPSAAAVTNLALAIDRVSHLTSSPLQVEPTNLSHVGRSNPCNVDVACRTTTPANLPGATGKLLFTSLGGQTGICSGTLLRDTLSSDPCPGNYNSSCRIYLLTAHHCIFTDRGANSLFTYWNFERGSCGGSAPNRAQFYGIGSELLEATATEDSTLLRLRYKPPVPTEAYARWFAKPLSYPTDVVAIHHPGGDLKKWSSGRVTHNTSQPSTIFTNRDVQSLNVIWNEGWIEGGSSGSGLFDSTGRLLGVASAKPQGERCGDADRVGYYGRFEQFYPHVRRWLNPVGPSLRGIVFSSTPVSGDTYQLGEVVEATVEFDRAVSVTGAPQLNLTVGSQTRPATYLAGSGSIRLRFEYLVQATDRDLHGMSIAANALVLNGGTIKDNVDDLTGVDLRHSQVAINSSHKVDGRLTTPPVVQRVAFTGTPAGGDTYRFNEAIIVTARFDRAVTVTGMPRLSLTIGSQVRQASYLDAVDLRTLSFDYIVQDTDRDSDGISVPTNALALNHGTIKLAGGTADAALAHTSVAADSSRKVDGNAIPTFAEVTVPAQAYIVNAPITPLTLPQAAGGNLPLNYALSPTAGLSLSRLRFDSETRILTGTPTMPMAETIHTLTATDADGDLATLLFSITIAADKSPTFGTATIAPQNYVQGRPVVNFGLPKATGGNPPLSYALSLPAGLSFTPDLHSINGTPTTATELTIYTLDCNRHRRRYQHAGSQHRRACQSGAELCLGDPVRAALCSEPNDRTANSAIGHRWRWGFDLCTASADPTSRAHLQR